MRQTQTNPKQRATGHHRDRHCHRKTNIRTTARQTAHHPTSQGCQHPEIVSLPALWTILATRNLCFLVLTLPPSLPTADLSKVELLKQLSLTELRELLLQLGEDRPCFRVEIRRWTFFRKRLLVEWTGAWYGIQAIENMCVYRYRQYMHTHTLLRPHRFIWTAVARHIASSSSQIVSQGTCTLRGTGASIPSTFALVVMA